jgi:TerC family integral membrane protein
VLAGPEGASYTPLWPQYLTCYITEYALSVDNIFVFLVIFTYFAVPPESQHRVLFWGVLGAMVFRGLFLLTGVALIERFHWTIWVLAGILILTGIKLLFSKDEQMEPEKNLVLRMVRRFLPVTDQYEGSKFFVRTAGRLHATPLFLTLLVIETTDILFAVDSVPAALGISQNTFVLYTSNIFAIMGLRSLFFAPNAPARSWCSCMPAGLRGSACCSAAARSTSWRRRCSPALRPRCPWRAGWAQRRMGNCCTATVMPCW